MGAPLVSHIAKQAKRHVQMESANPLVDLNPCLAKMRFESEEEANAKSDLRAYFCIWCNGWHTSAHGFKGARRGR